MALLYNLARMTTATTGTGTITLGSAVAGFKSFASAGVADGQTVTYAIEDGANSEIGRGVYTASGTTLTRSVLRSTNSDTAISLSGSAQVFITPAAEDFTDPDFITSINTGPLAGFRNKLTNGCFRINGRAATSVADDTYGFDRWYVLSQSGACAVSQLTNIENGTPYGIRITQSQASAQRFGLAQIITADNSLDLRAEVASLAARVRMSASTTLRCAILEWTGTANAVTSDFVLDWTNATFTAGNFFTSTNTTVAGTGSVALTANTLADISALNKSISASCNNAAVMIWTDSAQAQNVTLDIAKAQLEIGARATKFERRPRSIETALCLPHLFHTWSTGTAPGTAWTAGASQLKFGHVSGDFGTAFPLPVTMFSSSPTLTVYDHAGNSGKVSYYNGSWNANGAINSSGANDKYVFIQALPASSNYTNFGFKVEAEL